MQRRVEQSIRNETGQSWDIKKIGEDRDENNIGLQDEDKNIEIETKTFEGDLGREE